MLTEHMKEEILAEAGQYAHRRGACIDALLIAQKPKGWVDDETVHDIAALLGMTPEEVDSVATFYNLVRRKPVGRHVILLCTSVSCWILGYDRILEYFKEQWGIGLGQTTADNRFTLLPNQCLGTCDCAPAFMVDEDLHRNVEPSDLDAILARYE
jgi:NADH-quinone oxidoreductase subunit E